MTGERDWITREGLLPRLERTAAEVAADWGLTLGARIAAGRYSFVAPAGQDAILKIIPVEDETAAPQADALRFWDGNGAVRLLRDDRTRRALLLERVVPGTDASEVSEEEAIAAAIAVGKRIWRAPRAPDSFPSVDGWARMEMPANDVHSLVSVARRTLERIEIAAPVVAHADFHHHNILRRGDEWVVIDPKPVIAEPEFDVPTLLWNPIGTTPTRERTERRIRAFADAGLDADRIRAWTIVRGIALGLPLRGRREEDRPQLRVARMLL